MDDRGGHGGDRGKQIADHQPGTNARNVRPRYYGSGSSTAPRTDGGTSNAGIDEHSLIPEPFQHSIGQGTFWSGGIHNNIDPNDMSGNIRHEGQMYGMPQSLSQDPRPFQTQHFHHAPQFQARPFHHATQMFQTRPFHHAPPFQNQYLQHAPPHLQTQPLPHVPLPLQFHQPWMDAGWQSLSQQRHAQQQEYALQLLAPALQGFWQALELGPRVQGQGQSALPAAMFNLPWLSVGIVIGQSLRGRDNRNLNVHLNIHLSGRRRGPPAGATSNILNMVEVLQEALHLMPTITRLLEAFGQTVDGPFQHENLFIGMILGMILRNMHNQNLGAAGFGINLRGHNPDHDHGRGRGRGRRGRGRGRG